MRYPLYNRRINFFSTFIFIIVGVIYTIYRYYNGYISLNGLLFSIIAAMFLIVALLLLVKPPKEFKSELIGIRIRPFTYIAILYVTMIFVFFEIGLYNHLGIISVIILIIALCISAVSRTYLIPGLLAITSTMIPVISLYSIYTPSSGPDTWRDSLWALQIIKKGHMEDTTIHVKGYDIPLVPLLYAMHSIVSNIEPLWSGSTMGLVYFLSLSLWIFLVAKQYNVNYAHLSMFLVSVVPLITIWSVWFVPQAYSTLMAIPLIFFNLDKWSLLITGLCLVIGHGGTTIWSLLTLSLFAFASKLLNTSDQLFKLAKVKVLLILLLFIIYSIYTTMVNVLKGFWSHAISAFVSYISGEELTSSSILLSTQKQPTSLLSFIPFVTLAVFGFMVIFDDKNFTTRLLALIGLTGLAISYIWMSTSPLIDLSRYIGLLSSILLSSISPVAVHSLIKRGLSGKIYGILLLFTAIVSYVFAGTLMPGNPYVENRSSAWSVKGPVSYYEAEELLHISSFLCCNNYVIDWRSGAYLSYYRFVWINLTYIGSHDPETRSIFRYAGFMGFKVTVEHLKNTGEILIFRKSSINMPEAYTPIFPEELENNTIKGNVEILYLSDQFSILHFR